MWTVACILFQLAQDTSATEHITVNFEEEESFPGSTIEPLPYVTPERESGPLQVASFLPNDCLSNCLEYLRDEDDLQSIRWTSAQFNKMYHRCKAQQAFKFRILESIIPDDLLRSKYRTIEDLLQNAPLFPGIYVDFESNASIAILHHLQSDQVRGLDLHSNLPFISSRLWSKECPNAVTSVLLIAHFDFDGVAKVNIYWRATTPTNRLEFLYRKSSDPLQYLDLERLNGALCGAPQDSLLMTYGRAGGAARPVIWSVNKVDKQQNDRRLRRCSALRPITVVIVGGFGLFTAILIVGVYGLLTLRLNS